MGGGGGGGGDGGAAMMQAEESRKADMRGKVNALFDDPEAQQRFSGEETQVSDALRGYYTDQLKREYDQNERQLRFGAGNTGNIGGSAYADKIAKLNTDNAMGGTEISDAVTRAVNNLRAAREGTRMQSINLINGGAGPEAVTSAQQGLQQSLDAAKSGNKEQLFGDLFSNLAFNNAAGNANNQSASAMALFRNKLGSFFPTQPASGGTIIRTG